MPQGCVGHVQRSLAGFWGGGNAVVHTGHVGQARRLKWLRSVRATWAGSAMTSDSGCRMSNSLPSPVSLITREQLVEFARGLAQRDGEALSLATVRGETGLSRERILKLCGSWSELREAVGLRPYGPLRRDRLANEAIQDQLRAAVAEHGENITLVRFCSLTSYTAVFLNRRFGSWSQLRQSVGLSRRAKMPEHYTDQEIFDDMLEVVKRIRRKPTKSRYKHDGGKIGAETIANRFGGWQRALYAYEDELDRRLNTKQLRYRQDPHKLLGFYVFLQGKLLYYFEYDSMEMTTGKRIELPEGATM